MLSRELTVLPYISLSFFLSFSFTLCSSLSVSRSPLSIYLSLFILSFSPSLSLCFFLSVSPVLLLFLFYLPLCQLTKIYINVHRIIFNVTIQHGFFERAHNQRCGSGSGVFLIKVGSGSGFFS